MKLSEIAAKAKREPFAFPVSDDEFVMIPHPTVRLESAAVAAATSARTYTEGLLAGLAAYVGDEDAARIEAAYADLPSTVLAEVVGMMREHFSAA